MTLRHEIEVIAQSEYVFDGNFEEVLSKSVRYWVGQSILAEYRDVGVEKYLTGLTEAIEKIATLQLTLAFEPSDESITKMYDWVLSNVGTGIVLDIHYDPRLIVGATIAYKGKYGDYSFGGKMIDYDGI